MKIFISWSGERSRAAASVIRKWLPMFFHSAQTWMSEGDISPGTRWGVILGRALEGANFGILCLTKENTESKWLHFEAGALAKSIDETRVIPFLVDIGPTELHGPLAQFQALQADRNGVLRLLQAIEAVNPSITPDRVQTLFNLVGENFLNELLQERSAAAINVVESVFSVMTGNGTEEQVSGWLILPTKHQYKVGFEFLGGLYEQEIIIYQRVITKQGLTQSITAEYPWKRLASEGSHHKSRATVLTIGDACHLFVAGFHKNGPPDPALPWQPDSPSHHEQYADSLTLEFAHHLAGQSRMTLRACDKGYRILDTSGRHSSPGAIVGVFS